MILFIIRTIILWNRRVQEKLAARGETNIMRETFEKALKNPLLFVSHESDKVPAGDVSSLWVRCGKPGPVILYLHGGGYVIGSPGTHRMLAASILKRTGGSALIPDYRLAPEHPFPAQRDDTCAAYRWLLKKGTDPSGIAVMGDSAGGGLVVAMVQELQRKGIPLPACCVCLSPWTDTGLTGATMDEKAGADIILTRPIMEYYARCFAGNRDIRDTELSPLFGPMDGLPPFLIQVGSDEMLLDDSRRLAGRLREAGVAVTLEEYPGMFHGFHIFNRFLGISKGAINAAGRFISAHTRRG